MNELIRSRMRTRNLDFRMTSYISQKYDVKVSQSTTSTFLWKVKQGLHICGWFPTTNGCIDFYDLKGQLRCNLNREQMSVDVE